MRRLTRLLTIAATTLVVAAATASAGAAVGTIREYTGPIDVAGAQLVDIATGPNGNLWFTESGVGKIGRLDPRTGTIVEFDAGQNDGVAPERILLLANVLIPSITFLRKCDAWSTRNKSI